MTAYADEALAALASAADRVAFPRVRALHLPPPPATGEDRGEFAALELDDGTRVLGFLCESYALEGARDISGFGGWRNYLASLTSVHAQPRERP